MLEVRVWLPLQRGGGEMTERGARGSGVLILLVLGVCSFPETIGPCTRLHFRCVYGRLQEKAKLRGCPEKHLTVCSLSPTPRPPASQRGGPAQGPRPGL